MIGLSSDSAACAKTTHSNLGTKNMADSKALEELFCWHPIFEEFSTTIWNQRWEMAQEGNILLASTVTAH